MSKKTWYQSWDCWLEYVEQYSSIWGLEPPEHSPVAKYGDDIQGAILWDFSDIDRPVHPQWNQVWPNVKEEQ